MLLIDLCFLLKSKKERKKNEVNNSLRAFGKQKGLKNFN